MEELRFNAKGWWRSLQGTPPKQRDYRLTRWLFLRGLALVYFIAFLSLGVQILGLVGSNGIRPITSYLDTVYTFDGTAGYWTKPTLAWLDASDFALQAYCYGGALIALLALFGIGGRVTFFGCWVLYQTVYYIGQEFLSFQWDILLLETGFLAIFLAPATWFEFPASGRHVPVWILWLVRLLLFKLMFMSGYVKVPYVEWHSLEALFHHYETQPLPHVLGWFAHQLPEWFQMFSVVAMFFIELVVPFFLFMPRRVRFTGAGLITFLMLLIMLTGNFTYFNLLTILLAVTWLDDHALLGAMPYAVQDTWEKWRAEPTRLNRWAFAYPIVAVFWVGLSSLHLAAMLQPWQWINPEDEYPRDELPLGMSDILRTLSPYHVANSYGLFRSMTTTRPEIVIEGSNNGEDWLAYEFHYKPGDLDAMPRWCQPHQPRLDWQMWFAALSDYQRTRWFSPFITRLLRGSDEVEALLAENPFPDAPPKYIRARYYRYYMTGFGDEGWWKREHIGEYLPAVSLK